MKIWGLTDRGTVREQNQDTFHQWVEDNTAALLVCDGMGGARAGNVASALAVQAFTIRQITIDHSLVQDLLQRGHITPEEARNHPNKNVITRALGVDSKLEGDLFTQELEPGSMLLLCSDGLSNMLEDGELLDVALHGGAVGVYLGGCGFITPAVDENGERRGAFHAGTDDPRCRCKRQGLQADGDQ